MSDGEFKHARPTEYVHSKGQRMADLTPAQRRATKARRLRELEAATWIAQVPVPETRRTSPFLRFPELGHPLGPTGLLPLPGTCAAASSRGLSRAALLVLLAPRPHGFLVPGRLCAAFQIPSEHV